MKKKLLLLAFLASSAFAQQPKTIAIKAARLFDGTSDSVITNATVVVTGNRIVGVNVAAPAGAQVIDLGDVTLLPGFIDAHVHLTGESGENFYLDFFQDVMRQPAEQAFYAGSYARKTRDAGFTPVRNVGASDYIDVGLGNATHARPRHPDCRSCDQRDRRPRRRPAHPARARRAAERADRRRLQRSGGVPRRGALSDQVRRRRHQIHALGRRPLAL